MILSFGAPLVSLTLGLLFQVMANTWISLSAVAGELSWPLGTRGDHAGTAVPQPPLPGACRPLHGVFVPPPGSPCSPQNCCSSSERAVPPQGAGTSLPSGFSEDLGWGWVTPCETLCGDGENKAASVEQLGFIWEEFSL